jgi:hypothetical protein
MTEIMRNALSTLRNKIKKHSDNKKDKINRCWHLMKNIGAKKIYRIYLRRNGIEKLESFFSKWKREVTLRDIFGR